MGCLIPAYKNMISHIDLSHDDEMEIFHKWHYVSLFRSSAPLSHRVSLDLKVWCSENTIGEWYCDIGPHWDTVYFREQEDAIAFRLTWLL